MPKAEHRKLAASARRRGLTGARYKAYVYGTLSKIRKRRAAKSARRR